MSIFSKDELVEAFEYLDDLRADGTINMVGAAPYLARDLEHSLEDARGLLKAWMDTFDGDSPAPLRADKFLAKANP